MKIILNCVFVLFFVNQNFLQAQNINSFWSDVTDEKFLFKGERKVIPLNYRTFKLEISGMKSALSSAPSEFSEKTKDLPFILELPLPSGEFQKYYATDYPIMESGLSMIYPDIRTYNIKGIDDPYSTGKIDFTLNGFHAIIFTPQGNLYIEPYSTNEKEIYICYNGIDVVSNYQFECSTATEDFKNEIISDKDISTGSQLRKYRLAVAATGEYTAYHGGTVASALSEIVTAVNRINGVYERDLAVRLILVANNNLIVYTNSATDPYSDGNVTLMLSQNQTNLDNVIGSSNYDIGHVFGLFGSGFSGIATLRVVCVSGFKARGVSCSGFPTSDHFYIRLVAHEMGHQFGANHSFNSITGNCNSNRNASTAWEPGSGSSIMSYVGSCTPDHLQTYADDYFHTGNFSEIAAYTQLDNGNSCPQIVSTGNTPPAVQVLPGGFTIPINTPFQLTGSASDLENPNSLTYCWEEFDTGPGGSYNNPSGNAPIFRTFKPDTASVRIFPKISDIINNVQTKGELLPSYSRSLSFRLTVRDNNSAGGGVNYGYLQFNVSSSSGPFEVTLPNTNVILDPFLPQTVTWNVSNTNISPVSCINVNIKLSTNGGNTFPIMLLSNTSNDGSEIVYFPSVINTQSRIKVESSGNIFFDISNVNFTIAYLNEGFLSGVFPPSNWTAEFSGTNYWQRHSVSSYGIGSGSAKFDFRNAPGGTSQSLISLTIQSTINGDSLKFDNAYAPYTTGTDSLIIEISSNGGSSYSVLSGLFGNAAGGTLNTAPTSVTAFTPTNTQWSSKKYSLPAGTNKIKFRAKSGNGNNLYLDSINVKKISSDATPVPAVITLAPEGFYNSNNNTLNMKDTAGVYLRNVFSPYSIIDSGKNVIDSLNLTCSVLFNSAVTGTYYLQIKHRNSIETWSKSGGESYTRGLVFDYNFTSAQTQAFRNNLILKGTRFCIYSGDTDQDGVVDATDIQLIENDALNFAQGYIQTDINGDNFTDATDGAISQNNSYNFVSVIRP